jgi:hypothetical protein
MGMWATLHTKKQATRKAPGFQDVHSNKAIKLFKVFFYLNPPYMQNNHRTLLGHNMDINI